MEVHILIPENSKDPLEIRIIKVDNEKNATQEIKKVCNLVPQIEPKKGPRWPDEYETVCRYCGVKLFNPAIGRKKRFCSTTCRQKWWNQNRDQVNQSPDCIYHFTCKCCGKEFSAYGNNKRQYCSHECYVRGRFWNGDLSGIEENRQYSDCPSVDLIESEEGDFYGIQIIEPKKKLFQKLRVCAYCRVSTEEDEQANSLENQMSHYEEVIRSNPNYEFSGIYSDFGISGFKENRLGFQEMLNAARNHEFDLIITKSVSRFCRNTDTLLKAVRELKDLGIGVFFELQAINTLSESGELMLTVLAAFAQAESENYRSLAQMVYRRKFEAGIPVQHLERSFGYTVNEHGENVPEPNEAPWVKKIFELCAEGYNFSQIAHHLDENGVRATKGGRFTKQTVRHILESEIYVGDFIMHKYYVNDD